jgi:CRP-like cAMP-binding protein
VRCFATLDHAVEAAEADILAQWGRGAPDREGFDFLDATSRTIFLSHCEQRRVPAGTRLCTQGERSDAMFFVASWSCEVLRQDEEGNTLRLAKLTPGAMAGELAFYSGEPRAASIVAASEGAVRPDIASAFDRMVIGKLSHDLMRMNKLAATFH